MKTFAEYSDYYDLLYRDKPYEQEARWVSNRIRRLSPRAASLLDFGCGTGAYTVCFNECGFEAEGVDISEGMVARARAKAPQVAFYKGDILDFEVERPVDVITLLFHVMSYLTTDDELERVLANCARNLKPGGLLCFDVWHAPAVVAQKPEKRSRAFSDTQAIITRQATPTFDEIRRVVDVRYDMQVTAQGVRSSFTEHHVMRYFDTEEIETLLHGAGFDLVEASELLSGAPLSQNTWGAFYLARKNDEVSL